MIATDKAGINATEKAIGEIANLAYTGEVQLKILNLPNGKDADEYLHGHTSDDYQQLLTNAPLWLDWQIQNIIKNRDLKQATDFQQVTQQIVKLLQNIVNSDTLNYYVSYCAEILSLGDSRLKPLRVENLLTQIKPSSVKSLSPRTTNPQPKTPKLSLVTTERSLLERAEALLLIIYLHSFEQRQIIIEDLEARNLEFSLSHHRFLWQQMAEFTIDEIDLISSVQNRYLELGEELDIVSHIFHLNEKNKTEILRTPHVIQAAFVAFYLETS